MLIPGIYDMYTSKAFMQEPLGKLEKPGTEKAKIHKHSNKTVAYCKY